MGMDENYFISRLLDGCLISVFKNNIADTQDDSNVFMAHSFHDFYQASKKSVDFVLLKIY